jgi:hypothetical protein
MSEARYLVAKLGRSRISHKNMFVAVGMSEVADRLEDLYRRCSSAKLYDWSFKEWLIAMYGRGFGYDSVRVFRFDEAQSDARLVKFEILWKQLDMEAPVAKLEKAPGSNPGDFEGSTPSWGT